MVALFSLSIESSAQAVLVDDFTRANSNTVGGGWTEIETVATGAQISTNGLLLGSTTAGREWVYQDFNSLYTTTLSSNSSTLTWAFNMRTTRTDPSGLDASNYGLAYILGSTNNTINAGTGYAVLIGQAGTTDPIRLVRFTGGFDANSDVTNIISGNDYGSEYLSVRVTYNPTGNNWSLYTESNASAFPQSNPTATTTQIGSTTSDSNYTGSNLRYAGPLWNHATGGTENAIFDDIYRPSSGVNVNGTIGTNEYGTHTNGNNQGTNSITEYMTWDNTNLYIGIGATSNNTLEPAVFYLDVNPIVPVNGGANSNGSTTGYNNYDRSTVNLPFRGDFVVYFKSGYYEYRIADGAGGWSSQTSTGLTYAQTGAGSGQSQEISIPWSVVPGGARPASFNWCSQKIYNNSLSDNGIYGQQPAENPGGAQNANLYTLNYLKYYTVSVTTVGSSTMPFSRNSYTHPFGVTNNSFGGITAWDFTMNSSGQQIARLNSGGNWVINNNLVVNAGSLYFGSGGAGYGTTAITGNVDVTGGLLSMDQTNQSMNVTGNVTVSGGTLTLSGTSGGDLALAGNWTLSSGTFNPSSRAVTFNSSTASQTITGNTTFDYLTVNNTFATPTLTLQASSAVTANTNVNFTNGRIVLGANNLTLGASATVTTPTTAKYFVTNSTGLLIQPVSTSAVTFHTGNSSYNPITLTPSAGSAIPYRVRVIDAVTSPSPFVAAKLINRYWSISAPTAAANTLTMQGYWNTGEANGSYAAGTQVKVAYHNGTAWAETNSTQGGANPFNSSGAFAVSAGNINSGITFGIGKDDGFINSAVSYTWNGATDTNWATSTNWTPNGVPGSSDNVIISVPGTNTLSMITTRTVVDFTVSGTGTFGATSAATLNVTGTITSSTSASITLDCASTVNISNAGSQNIPAWSYGNLNTTGGARVWASGATTNICGTFTPGAGAFTVGTSTVAFNGTGAQSIAAAASFATLNITNTGGTVSMNGNLSVATAMTINASAILDIVSGTPTLNSGSTTNVNGRLKNSSANIVQTGATITVGATGTYEHNRVSGAIITATWSTGSNCLISNAPTSAPTNIAQSFSDFTWSGAMTGSFSLASGLTTVGRDFIVTTTNGQNLGLTSTTALALTIGRDFIITGGNVIGVTGANTLAVSITVGNDLSITGAGSLIIAGSASSSNTSTTTMDVTNAVSVNSTALPALVITDNSKNVTLTVGNGFTKNNTGSFNIVDGTGAGTLNITSGNFSVLAGTVNMVSGSTGLATINQNNAANGMILSGGIFNTLGSTAGNVLTANRPIVTLAGSYSQSGSSAFDFAAGSVTSAAIPSGELRVAKNFTRTSTGSMTTTSASVPNNALITFNGTTQNYDATGLTGDFSYIDVQIANGSNVSLLSDMTLYGNPQTVTILSGGRLTCSTYAVTSGAALGTVMNVASGATISTQNIYGFTTSTTGATGGSVQTNTRTYNSGATYIFRGTALQGTGNFFTAMTGTANTVANMTIDNTTNVNLDATAIVSGTLTMTNGHLYLGTNNLTAATISGVSAARHIKTASTGQLKMVVAASPILFPVGNSAYNPITLTNSGTSDTYGFRVVDGVLTTANDTTKAVGRAWVVTENVAGASSLAVVAQYNTGEQGSNFNSATTPKIGFYKGSPLWVTVNATAAGSNPFTYTSNSNFAPADMTTGTQYFGVGKDDAFLSPTVSYTWNGVTDTDWAVSTNWTPNGVPTSTDSVTINIPGTNTLDLASVSHTCGTLTLSGTGTFNITGNATLTVAGAVAFSSSSKPTLSCTSTFQMSSSTSQTVPAWQYGNLNTAGGDRILASSDTIKVCGTFTRSAGVQTITGSTVEFNGTTAQSIAAGLYNNLIISQNRGGGTVTLPTGTIDVAGSFNPSLTNYTVNVSTNTFNFSSAGAQTFPAFFYYAVTNTGNGNRTWASSGTIDVAHTFTPSTATNTITGSSFRYSSNTATNYGLTSFTTNVAGRQYNNLEIVGGASTNYALATSVAALGVAGNLIYSGSGIFRVTNLTSVSSVLTVDGNFTMTGSGLMRISGTANTGATAALNVTGNTVISNGTFELVGSVQNSAHGTFTTNNLTISGTASMNLESTTGTGQATATVNGNLSVTSTATPAINLGSGTNNSNNTINLKGNFSKSGAGTLAFTGTNTTTAAYIFNGTGTQTWSHAGTAMVGGNFTVASGSVMQLQNSMVMGSSASANGLVVAGTLDAQTFTVTPGNAANTFALQATGTLITENAGGASGTINGYTAANTTWTGNAPGATFVFKGNNVNTGFSAYTAQISTTNNYTMTWLGTGNLTLDRSITLTEFNYTNNGLVFLGNNNLTVSSSATLGGGSFGTTKMLVTNGTGSFIRNYLVGGFSGYVFPIGDSTGTLEYSPVTVGTLTTTIAGTMGFRVVDGAHPNNGLATSYLTRYWPYTYTGSTTSYSWSNATFGYDASDIVVGPEASLKANSFDAGSAAWTQYASSSAASSVLTITSGPTHLNLFTGNDITARIDVPVYYQSATTGNWNTAATWEISTDPAFVSPAGVTASTPPTATNSTGIFIRNGHTVTANTTISADQITINSGGTLNVTNNTFTVANGTGTDLLVETGGVMSVTAGSSPTLLIASGSAMSVNGIFRETGTTPAPTVTATGTITINSGGVYDHNINAGTIPSCTWAAGSTCLITGTTNNAPSGLSQSFQNFTVNCTLTNSVNCSANLTTINGKFKLTTNHASFQWRLSTGTTYTLTVTDSLIIADGILDIASGGSGPCNVIANGPVLVTGAASRVTKSGAATATWTFNNDFNLSAGVFEMNEGGSSNTTVNFKGNTILGGTFLRTNGGTHIVNFNKASGNQTLTQTGTQGAGAITWNIGDGTLSNTVQLLSDVNLGASAHTFVVQNGSTLNFGPSVLSGSNTGFTLNATGAIRMGSVEGIRTAPTALGNLQTLTRNFPGTASYFYNGTANQITGNALPTTFTTTGNLNIANTGTSGNNTVTLINNNTTVPTFNLISGLFAAGAPQQLNITSGGTVNATGGDFATGSTAGLLNFPGTGTFTGSCSPYNVNIAGGVNFGAGTVTIQNTGTLKINAGGFANTNGPFYASGSTLQYNTTGNYGRGLEWNAASGRGYPHHVQVSNSTTLQPGGNSNTNTVLNMAGNLTIDASSNMYLDFGGMVMNTNFNVLGGVTLNGNLSLSSIAARDMYVGGDWTANTGSLFNANTRAVFLNGTGTQNIGGTLSSTFPYLILNNAAGATLTNSQTVSTTLTLTSGNLTLANFDLNNNGTISGATTAKYIVTNGSGRLKQTVAGSAVAYPVGNVAYNPITLTNTGTADIYGIIETDGAAGFENDPSKIVVRNWNINEAVVGGGNLALTAQWNAPVAQTGEEGSNFIRGNSPKWIGNYTGGSWSAATATLAGSNPYTYTASGFTTTGIFEVGIADAFTAIPLISSYTPTSGYAGDTLHIVGTNLNALTSVTIGGTPTTLTTPAATSTDAYYIIGNGTTGNLVATNAAGSVTAATAFTFLGYITDNNTDWNTASTWRGGNVPPLGAVTTINSDAQVNSTVFAAAPSTVTINSGKSLTFGAAGALTVNTGVTNNGTIVMTAGGTLTMAASGVLTNNSTFTAGIGEVIFAGAGTLNGSSASTMNNFTLNGGATLTTVPTIAGTLQLNSGGFVSTGPNYASGSILKYNSGGNYGRGAEWSTASGAGYPHHVQVSNSTTLQPGGNSNTNTVLNMAGNLTIDASSNMYLDFGGMVMNTNFNVLGGVTLNGNLSLSSIAARDMYVGGDWTANTGSLFNANTRAVFLNGTGTQNIGGTLSSTFPYLLLNKTAGNVVLGINTSVSNTLTFQAANVAIINTGAFLMIVSNNATAAVVRTGLGHVNGTLRRAVATGTNTYNFAIGDATNYTPASLVLTGVTVGGNMDMFTSTPDHPQLATSGYDGAKSVNRYWTLSQSGVTLTSYNPTFTFVAGDLDGGTTTANLLVAKYESSAWTFPTVGTRTATTTQATGVTGYGEFALAECKVPATFTVSGGGSFCSGGSGLTVTLSGSETFASYQLRINGFDSGSPVVGTGSAINFINQTAPGIYTVYAYNTGSATCNAVMTGSATITVNPTVTPSVSIVASPGSNVCAGTSVTFTATPQFGGTTPSYQWKVNGSNVGTDTTVYSSSTLANNDAVTCVMTSNVACGSPLVVTSNAIIMTIVANLAPSISISANPGATGCAGFDVTFTATPTNGGITPAYQWKLNGGNVGTNSNTYTNGTLTTGNQITCELTTSYQCPTTPTATSNTITMTMTPSPSVFAGTAMSTCGTAAYTFSNGASNSNTASILWTHNGAGSITAGATTLTPTYTPVAGDVNNTVTFTLTGTGNAPCASQISQVTLFVNPLVLYYLDTDGDGFGDPLSSPVAACSPPIGRVANNTDCCDTNANINPLCEWWADIDGDGYGSFIFDVGCAYPGCSIPAQLIPYYPAAPANAGASYVNDCNDNNILAYPGASEICQNSLDDDCNGIIDNGCNAAINDYYVNPIVINTVNANTWYPNCLIYNGSLVNANVSPESNPANVVAAGGRDIWYRFVAQSTAAQIQVTPLGFDAVIELRTAAHPAGQIDVENINATVGGLEVLNTSALSIGQTYYVAVRNYNNTNLGTFTLCVKQMMPSGCAYTIPAGGFPLCNTYKALFRGADSYTFRFTGTGGGAPAVTTSGTSNGLIALSTPSLDLRYGGIYNVRVDANYNVFNGLGAADPSITVIGSIASANCTGVTMIAQPLIEVRSTQRCPATLTRSNYLIGNPVTGSGNACGAINFTYRFTQVTDCSGAVAVGLPFSVTTPLGNPYLILAAAFPSPTYPLPNLGTWKVEIRPNFTYGPGVFGPAQHIQVNSTSTSVMNPNDNELMGAEKSVHVEMNSGIYPNPSKGDMVNINLTNVKSENVYVNITDAMGRIVHASRYSVDGSLNTMLVFEQPLSAGVYMVEFVVDGYITVEKMIVQK